jgi:hypothetical protein
VTAAVTKRVTVIVAGTRVDPEPRYPIARRGNSVNDAITGRYATPAIERRQRC